MIASAPVGEPIPLEVAAQAVGRSTRTLFLWIEKGWLDPKKVKGDQRTYVDPEQLPSCLAKSGRGPRQKKAP